MKPHEIEEHEGAAVYIHCVDPLGSLQKRYHYNRDLDLRIHHLQKGGMAVLEDAASGEMITVPPREVFLK